MVGAEARLSGEEIVSAFALPPRSNMPARKTHWPSSQPRRRCAASPTARRRAHRPARVGAARSNPATSICRSARLRSPCTTCPQMRLCVADFRRSGLGGACASGVPAAALNFRGFVCALAVGTAIFGAIGGNTIAGRMCTFLGRIGHSPPLVVLRDLGFDAAMSEKDAADSRRIKGATRGHCA